MQRRKSQACPDRHVPNAKQLWHFELLLEPGLAVFRMPPLGREGVVPDVALDLRFLRYATVAAEQGSFRKAAAALGISQASVSRRVAILEHRLGFMLFHRMPTGLMLTRSGESFLSEAAKGIVHLDRAVQLAASMSRGERGMINVGILASLNSGYLREVFIRFREKHANVELTLHESTAQENLHSLVLGELDVCFTTGMPDVPGYLTEFFWRERILLVMPSNHPLAAGSEVTWDQMQGEKFLVTSGGPGPEIHDYLVKHLATLGYRPDIAIQHVGRESLNNLVAIGYGLSLVSASALGHEIPGLTVRPVTGEGETLESSAMWSSKNSNPALGRLLSIARTLRTSTRSQHRSE